VRVGWRRRVSGHDTNCEQAVSLVAAYLDGALKSGDLARFEAHIAECPMCREHLKQIETTILVTGELRAEDLDPLAREDLMNVYRRWRDSGP
jgi:anti-sigma factor RsiW